MIIPVMRSCSISSAKTMGFLLVASVGTKSTVSLEQLVKTTNYVRLVGSEASDTVTLLNAPSISKAGPSASCSSTKFRTAGDQEKHPRRESRGHIRGRGRYPQSGSPPSDR